MGRRTVRTAVASYMGSGVAGLNQVTRAKPRNVKPGSYGISTTRRFGAIGWLYIEGEHEHRMSSPVVAGKKQVTYMVGLRVDFRSELSDTETGIDAYDDIIEAIKAKLRADPTLGTGPNGVVFQAGEGDLAGAPDIEVIADEPQESSHTTTTIRSVVRFMLVEIITA